ncbi:MAG TPA: tetratricopeptide repeat protein [Longimicrobiaceae bacterium]|jgi:tetratricopeptide (TPR) repeat protein|nr:tetratricopeptide repeat protein [Longimicrobiaceae bacterium]
MRRFLPAIALLSLGAARAHAQRTPAGAAPPRPRLEAMSDTNDATAYYTHGFVVLEARPAEAAASFYWARRINPAWADAYYAERTALLMTDKDRLLGWMNDSRRVLDSPAVLHIDSLYDRAATADPFLAPKLDRALWIYWYGAWRTHGNSGVMDDVKPAEIQNYLTSQATPPTRAWLAFSEGRYAQAVDLYDAAIRWSSGREKAPLRLNRARALYLAGRYPEALAGMQQGITEWRKDDDTKRVVFLYRSKAHLEQSVGLIHEKMGDKAAAREAYGRALTEDISYFPAHVRLSALALAAGDTASAISEMDLAVQIRPGDGSLRYNYGFVLGTARKFEEAAEQFKKAQELEPSFAAPYYMLARIYDASGMQDEATANYRAFVARASRRDQYLPLATQRLAELAAPAAPAPAGGR